MSQVGQGQRVSPVVACYGYFQGIDTVNAPARRVALLGRSLITIQDGVGVGVLPHHD